MPVSRQTCAFISYSANHEDVLLNRIFRGQKIGFYIDVGAAHPVFENDTKALYDRGWSGINIEPNKSFFDILAAERPRDHNLNIAVSNQADEITFFEVMATGLSTCDPEEAARAREKGFEIVERSVKTETLRDLLEAERPAEIDLLKIDVEGFEPNVIRSNDWNRFRPRVILIEATFPETPLRRPDVISPLLEREGYRRVYFDGLNDYYIERSFAAPDGAFDTPPNVFDNFMPLAQRQLRRERDFLHEKVESLEQERANALAEIASLRGALGRPSYLEEDLARAQHEMIAMRARMVEINTQMEDSDVKSAAMHGQISALMNQIAEGETERAAMRAVLNRLPHLQEDLARARHELLTMRARMTNLTNQLESSEAESYAARDRMAELAEEVSNVEVERASAIAMVDAMLRSTSWRLTRSIRAVRRPRRTLRILITGRQR